MSTQTFDIIIAGAGASGLSLLWNLLQSDHFQDKKILLTDLNFEPANDKTWCFWDDSKLPQKEIIHFSWDDLEVRAKNSKIRETLQEYKYHCVRSSDFSNLILNRAGNDQRVTFLKTEILGFEHTGESSLMKTTDGNFQSGMIFQSVLKPPVTAQTKSDISLKQHFLGWEIETRKDLFNPNRAIFMDFEVPQKDGVTFFYVLPFSSTQALIEYTLFSENLLTKDDYEDALKNYLNLRYGLTEGDYTISRRENGIIPMEDRRYPATYCPGVYNIGTMGGVTKPSSGYAFTRILEHTKRISDAVISGNPIPDAPASSYRFRVYDMMLLYLLKNEPITSVQIFHDLFQYNSFDRVLHFLDEKTNFVQELKIFSTVPYLPFLKSIWKMKHRIFTGA